MSTTLAPDPVSTVRTRDTRTLRRAVVAVLLPLGPLAVAGIRGYLPYFSATSSEETVAQTATAPEIGRGMGYWYAYGRDGLSPRNDLAGLNLETRPTALVECANMRNAAEAAVVSSAAGRDRYAAAIAEGILRFLDA